VPRITDLTAETALASDDYFPIWNTSGSDTKKVSADTMGLSVPNVYRVNASGVDQGAATAGTIKTYVDAIGTSQKATIVCGHTSTGNTTTYTLTTSEVTPSNITLEMEHGAILDGAGTLTVNGPFVAGWYPVFGETISVRLLQPGGVKANWWVTSGAGTSADPWIVDLQTLLDSIYYGSRCLMFAKGYYEVDAVGIINDLGGMGVHIKGSNTILNQCRIYLADGADCSIFKVEGAGAVSHPLMIENLSLYGNKANQTANKPLLEINNSYNVALRDLRVYESDGDGIKFDGTTVARADIKLENVKVYDSDGAGLHMIGQSGVSINGGCDIEGNDGGAIKLVGCSMVNIEGDYFEPNSPTAGVPDILVDSCVSVFIERNHLYGDNDTDAMVKVTNGSRGCFIGVNRVWYRPTLGADEFWLYFDNTTYGNAYRNTQWDLSSEGGLIKPKIYDAGANVCLDPDADVVRPPTSPIQDGHYYPQLTGPTREMGGNAGNWLTNYILYSEDLTNAAWDDATATATGDAGNLLPTGIPGAYQSVAFTDGRGGGNTSFVDQDVTIAVKTGDVLTFSIFVFAVPMESTGCTPMLYLGDSGANFTAERDFDVKSIPITGTAYGWKRLHVTVVATEDAATMVCKLANGRNAATNIKFWGAQLNKGPLTPYIKTEAATVTVYPGLKTHHLTASGGINSGWYTTTFAAEQVVNAFYAKNHDITLTANITKLTINPASGAGLAGTECVIKFIQDGTGNRTLAVGAGNVKLAGGACTLTAAGASVDMLTFVFDGTYWQESGSRSQDVK